eukprot:COSAG06_NODE_428_length_15883_cov_47.248289_12_plen_161_part_00
MAAALLCWLMALSTVAAAAAQSPPLRQAPPNCTVCAHCTNCPPHCSACVAARCATCAHGDCPQHCTRLRPYPPLLPIGPGSFAMNRSTLAMAYNISGIYDPQLAARFGAISFDHDNARQLWLASIPNGSVHHLGFEKRTSFAMPSYTKNDRFTTTGSGQS